jgi:hypothetical protein
MNHPSLWERLVVSSLPYQNMFTSIHRPTTLARVARFDPAVDVSVLGLMEAFLPIRVQPSFVVFPSSD